MTTEEIVTIWTPPGCQARIEEGWIGSIWIRAEFDNDIVFRYREYLDEGKQFSFGRPNTPVGPRVGLISMMTPYNDINNGVEPYWDNDYPADYQSRVNFAHHWMSFFRRCVFLCGCDIEHTATEEFEWRLSHRST